LGLRHGCGYQHPRGSVSRLSIVAHRPHSNASYLLDGRRRYVSRGFAEVDIQAQPDFTFALIAVHLKSRRTEPEADEAEMRLSEANILRGIVDNHFKTDPGARLIVLGDFNDVKNSDSTKAIIGHGRFRLTDTRPAERNGDNVLNPIPRFDPRNVTWTHYYGLEDSYSRIDYILLSPALARDWVTNETYVATVPNWGLGSDHRPIVVTLATGD
jgi:endonuclease/exonuclease/phosphatase family metal-dependent hydrolase